MTTAAAASAGRFARVASLRGDERALRVLLVPAVIGGLWGGWELYKWLWQTTGWTWPFAVDDTTMPHIHDIFAAFGRPAQTGGPLLITALLKATWFTAKEALAGFALGAAIGFLLAVLLAHSRLLERGLLPYVVASQTVPILAIAPMVVVGLGSKGVEGWQAVAVIAAYLTFFPVAVNELRGLKAVDPRALELMRSYAAGSIATFRWVRIPNSLPFTFTGLKVATVLSMIGAIVGEYFGGPTNALGVSILNDSQLFNYPRAWAGIALASAFGILFYAAVALVEHLATRWKRTA